MMKNALLLIMLLPYALFADKAFDVSFCPGYQTVEEEERNTKKILKKLEALTGSVSEYQPSSINIYDTECVIAISVFFKEIGLPKNKHMKFNPQRVRSAKCQKHKSNPDRVRLIFSPVVTECSKQRDIIAVLHPPSFIMTYDIGKQAVIGGIRKE